MFMLEVLLVPIKMKTEGMITMNIAMPRTSSIVRRSKIARICFVKMR